MRLLILTNKKRKPYSNYLLMLLSKVLAEKVGTIQTKTGIKDDNVVKSNHKNEIVSRDFSSPFSSIFQSLYLKYFLRKQKIEVIVQFVVKTVFSSGLPQLIVPVDTAHLIIKKKISASAKIVVASQAEKQKFILTSPLTERNIYVVPASAGASFQPISWSEKQAVKMQYTQGKEYFLINPNGTTEAAFTSILKAFSAFKKWQHSSMKLVINGRLSFNQNKEWIEKINTYRYREDVAIIDENDAKRPAVLLAAAYAFLHVPLQDNDVVSLLEAMQCETPCISFFTDTIKEYTGTACILTDRNNYEQIGDKMILLYKDETLRSQLIEEGKKQAYLYSKHEALRTLTSLLPDGIH